MKKVVIWGIGNEYEAIKAGVLNDRIDNGKIFKLSGFDFKNI